MSLEPRVAIETLIQLDRELGPIDPTTRAIVGLRPDVPGTVALVDVSLADNGVLEVEEEVAGLIVVTSEELATTDVNDEVVGITQLLCVLRDGVEFGLYRIEGDEEPRVWRTDADPDDGAPDLRPRDLTSNTARRALGLASLAEPVPLDEIVTRVWLLEVATAAMQAFDAPDGPREIGPEELGPVRDRPPVGDRHGGEAPTWEGLHTAARAGQLDLGGQLTVDPQHAAWLDTAGFAQVLDRTLPSVDELLGSLRVTGDDELQAWVISRLAAEDDDREPEHV